MVVMFAGPKREPPPMPTFVLPTHADESSIVHVNMNLVIKMQWSDDGLAGRTLLTFIEPQGSLCA
jgi:hypothetical protein